MQIKNKTTDSIPNRILQTERIRRGWTQQELARRTGTTVVNVSRWERGVTSPNPYFRQQLCAVFGMAADELHLCPPRPEQIVLADEDRLPEVIVQKVTLADHLARGDAVLLSKVTVAHESDIRVATRLPLLSPIRRHRSLFLNLSVILVLLVLAISNGILIYSHFFIKPPAGLLYSFEDGKTDGWVYTGHVLSMQNSSQTGGYDGTHALQVTFSSRDIHDKPFVSVNPPTNRPQSGQMLSAAIFVPHDTTSTVTAMLYVQDTAYSWHDDGFTTLKAGQWNLLHFSIPPIPGPALQVGIQYLSLPTNIPVTIHIDSVEWGST